MKTIKLYFTAIFLFGILILFSSCSRDILDQLPKDQISSENYWRNPADFELYLNQFYPELYPEEYIILPQILGDNVIISNDVDPKLEGTRVVPASGGGWDFNLIRRVNYIFESYDADKLKEAPHNYAHYLGEAYFFRAYFYFNLVKNFGDVPYFSKVLTMDSEELYMPRTPRQQVVDNIIEDLNNAIANLVSGPNVEGMRLNKEVAQLFKSRVCLYEGTWEKYHNGTVFGVSNPKINVYLEMAADAAQDVIESNYYNIYSTGDPTNDYYNVFNRISYSGHPEVMLWEKFSVELNRVHRRNKLYWGNANRNRGITKNLVDEYLCIDGLPKAISPLYQGDNTLTQVMINRDLRLSQSIFKPGDPWFVDPYPGGDTTVVYVRSGLPKMGKNGTVPTGYEWRKGYRPDPLQMAIAGGQNDYTGDIHFRYAEALLNYAEAKAELETINQDDINMTINKLRDRVNMAHLILNSIANDPDWTFPHLSPIINEIRRERRVEFVGEHYHRWNDLARWRAHELFVGKRFLGAKFDPVMYPELVGNKNLFLTADGYIDWLKNRLPNGYGFNPDRDYLDPLPTSELTLNENLIQNPGW